MPGRILWHVAGLVVVMLLAAGCTLGVGGAISEAPTPEISGAPVVSIVAPLPNTTYLKDVSINVLVRVANAGSDIDRVEVAVDGTVIASLPDPNTAGAEAFSVIQTWIAASGQHTLSAVAYRADNSASQPASVTVNVVDELPSAATDTPAVTPTAEVSPTPQVQPTNTQAQIIPTNTQAAAPTSAQVVPTTATSTTPRVKALGFTNVRRGPSTNFIPPIGALNTNEEVDILALNTGGDWIKIRFNSGEGWVFRQIVEVVGDITNVPREAGPPIPTLPPATNTPPAPAVTAAPTTGGVTGTDGPDLVITGFALFPVAGGTKDNIFVNEPVYVQVRVRNNGNRDAGGFFVVLEVYDKNENALSFPPVAVSVGGLGAGQETLVEMGYTDPDNPGRLQSAVVTVDRNNQVAETNESNNSYPPIEYTLGAR